MKKYLLPSLLLCAASAFAQTTTYTLNVHLKNGDNVQYKVADIERITFDGEQETPEPTEVFAVQIPADFSTGWVQKVMNGDKQVAEVAKEYINSIKKQVVVVYPMNADGRADLTKGLTSTGASVVWDMDANTATVGQEGEALTTVYVAGDKILPAYSGETVASTLSPYVISDRRGLFERNTYKIVKIGTQYWMAENLRTTYFRDGTSIASISSGEDAVWKANTTGAYLASTDSDWLKVAGHLYNGYCVTSEKGIAPEGWEVPSTEQWKKLRIAGGGDNAANFKAADFGMWGEGMTGNNITGFDAVATGTYLNGDITAIYSDTYFWGSTVSTSWLKVEGLCTFRLNGTSTKVVVSGPDDCHKYTYGHPIRCVRK